MPALALGLHFLDGLYKNDNPEHNVSQLAFETPTLSLGPGTSGACAIATLKRYTQQTGRLIIPFGRLPRVIPLVAGLFLLGRPLRPSVEDLCIPVRNVAGWLKTS